MKSKEKWNTGISLINSGTKSRKVFQSTRGTKRYCGAPVVSLCNQTFYSWSAPFTQSRNSLIISRPREASGESIRRVLFLINALTQRCVLYKCPLGAVQWVQEQCGQCVPRRWLVSPFSGNFRQLLCIDSYTYILTHSQVVFFTTSELYSILRALISLCARLTRLELKMAASGSLATLSLDPL